MNEDNLKRLIGLLLLTWGMCTVLYWLPQEIAGYRVKRIDLLSDLREKPASFVPDTLPEEWELELDSLALSDSLSLSDSLPHPNGIDSASLLLRDSLYRLLYSIENADSLGTRIEDYSLGHIGLQRFFHRLAHREELGRPIRIGVLGDSFIEGDILVADLRSGLQSRFGGGGVGFVPITSVAAQFRATITVESEGWATHSLLTDHTRPFTFTGLMFEPEEAEACCRFTSTGRYPHLQETASWQLLYEAQEETPLVWIDETTGDSLRFTLSPTEQLTRWELPGCYPSGQFRLGKTNGFETLGFVLEDSVGVSVDNFSLRGHSGLGLLDLDSAQLQALDAVRPYDLLILQYGLNVVQDSVMQYGWYASRMVQAIQHLKRCLPETDLLMLSVSDRAWQAEDGTFETMPAVLALLHAQRKAAKRAGIPFWNLFGAMGGENSMVRYVDNNWAGKDYTHLGFRGGKEIAHALLEVLLAEKAFYDEAENKIP